MIIVRTYLVIHCSMEITYCLKDVLIILLKFINYQSIIILFSNEMTGDCVLGPNMAIVWFHNCELLVLRYHKFCSLIHLFHLCVAFNRCLVQYRCFGLGPCADYYVRPEILI